MKTALAMVVAVAALILVACVDRKTDSPITPPGQAESVKTKTLEAGAAILQNKPPIEAINAYLDGFHFYNGREDVVTDIVANWLAKTLNVSRRA